MTTLHPAQRNLLDKIVVAAREAAEKAAEASLRTLAVHQEDPYAGMSQDERALRRELRAEARRLGGAEALATEIAYAQWHRMLFARFLAENGLLMHPEGVAVTLDECSDLAAVEGEADGWMVAAKYAALMLPGIFRQDDPTVRVRFAIEGRQSLEKILADLPPSVFTSEDALGWVYQFWQTKRKADVNAKGEKIGGADISAVTQLFTEPYMVQFLLHNSLGAWWAARHPDSPLLTDFTYLRLADDGKPAAGKFPGWPATAREIRIIDPCCGSGHFLVSAFEMLRRMRMDEEDLSEAEAGEAVLRDNLHGLELDPRCTQIATFALALAAWKSGGYRPLPLPHVACSGLAVGGELKEWNRLVEPGSNLNTVLWQLYHWFKNAPHLGSLIDPTNAGKTPLTTLVPWDEVQTKLTKALERFKSEDDPAAAVFGETALGTVRAAGLLFGRYHLVVTNVPFLARGKQETTLRDYCSDNYPAGKSDLATAFVERCLSFCESGGSMALVTPQNWLFLGSYKNLRERLLKEKTWDVVAKLGENGFESAQAAGAFTALFVLTQTRRADSHTFFGIDASAPRIPFHKAELLRCGPVHIVSQAAQMENPDSRLSLEESASGALLRDYADGLAGVLNGDSARFRAAFWEVPCIDRDWAFIQSTVEGSTVFGGREGIILWEEGRGQLRLLAEELRERLHDADRRGNEAWGRHGIAVSSMRTMPVTLYTGELFDSNAAVILPRNPAHLPAIWAYCSSPEFHKAVRRIDQALKVTNASLVKVPFDLTHWQKVADEQYPDGLPTPHSNDPTQWLFHGHPVRSTAPLHVAVARILGYHWPEHGLPPTPTGRTRQADDGLDAHSDADGLVYLPPILGEPPAAERLRALLADAYGADYGPDVQERLLGEVGYAGRSLDEWLREGFFAGHCKLFGNRPFVWHVWDGRRDGFSALVNYHSLDRAKLEKLAFASLGDWIRTQRDGEARGEAGANARLVAALTLQEKLKLILYGEPPYDLFIRWKPLAKQPLGWEPDLNDGVRMNARPFVQAGILRAKFTINWNKDRGTNPDRTERLNDEHYTRAEKEEARR